MFAFMIISMVATMAASAASARAQYMQGKQAEANAEYNAQVKEDQAREEQAIRSIEATEERKVSRRKLASMEARFAKSGLLMSGTPTLMLSDQAKADEFNILSRDRGSIVRTQNLRTEADLLRIQGSDAASAGVVGAGTSLLGGAASAASIGASYGSRVGAKAPATNGILD